MGERLDWQQRAGRLFCYCIYIIGAYFAVKYLLFAAAPVLVAFCLSAAVHYTAGKISKKTRLPQGAVAVALLTLILLLTGFAVFYACKQLLAEVRTLLSASFEDRLSFVERALQMLENIKLTSSLASLTEEYASTRLEPIISSALSSFATALSGVMSRLVRSTPSAVISGILTLISCYYMSVDFGRISSFLLGLLPVSASDRLKKIKSGALSVAFAYLKGYSVLFLITFAEALIGLFILCPSYAWLWALIIAAVDVLPVLGAGTVLIPWGVVSIINGQYFLGFGLIVLYVIITAVRQIAEPYVLGKGLGLHPLASLMAMFIGFRLFGALGMMLSPIALAVLLRVRTKE